MGACTTIKVTSKAAKRFLVDHILYNASISELEALLDELLKSRCYNAYIVPDDEANNDDTLEY